MFRNPASRAAAALVAAAVLARTAAAPPQPTLRLLGTFQTDAGPVIVQYAGLVVASDDDNDDDGGSKMVGTLASHPGDVVFPDASVADGGLFNTAGFGRGGHHGGGGAVIVDCYAGVPSGWGG